MVVNMKKIILLLLLFICPNTYSADFVDSFQEYRHQIKRKLGHDTSSTSPADTTYNQMIREAVIKIMPIVQGRKESFSFVTTYRSDSYALDTTVSGVMSVYWSKNDSIKTLIKAPKESWYSLKRDDESILANKEGYQSRPSYYDYVDGTLFLFPTPPRNGDTIRYDAYTKINSITALDSLSLIPQRYRIVILEYASYLMAQNLQHSLMNVFREDYNQSIQFLLGGGANVTTTGK